MKLNKRSTDSGKQYNDMHSMRDKVRSYTATPSTDVTLSSAQDSSFDEYYDCNSYDDQSFSSYYEDSVSSLPEADHQPMIEIVQEITERRIIRSTVRLNRSKIQKFRHSMAKTSPPQSQKAAAASHPNDTINVQTKRRKSKQKSVRDNVHNEILDQNRDHSVDREVTSDATGDASEAQHVKVSTIDSSSIRMGKLEAKCNRSAKPVGRLMNKRLERDRKNAQCELTNMQNDENGNKIPPIKPPRIFASSSATSGTSSKRSSDCRNSSATVAIEDLQCAQPTRTENKHIGWQFSSDTSKLTCPPADDVNHIEWLCSEDATAKYGWTRPFAEKPMAVQQVYNMLNYDQRNNKVTPVDITSYNLLPEPQHRVRNAKESIDTVDCPSRMQQQCEFEKFANATMFSTPIKSGSSSAEDICHKCKLKIQKPPSPQREGFVRQSFKKNALKRTKSFFQASRRKISAKQPSPYPKRMAYSDSEDYTPAKSDATERMNRSLMDESGKKSVKTLGFTPQAYGKSPVDGHIDNDNEQNPSNRTPPQKPVRRKFFNALDTGPPVEVGLSVSEPNFDFRRIIHSPKRDRFTPENLKRSFKLSPKRLFKTINTSKQSSPKTMDKSYKSFVDTEDDFIVLMGEYLQRMCYKINGIEVADDSTGNVGSDPPVSLSRAASVSSDTLATVIPPQLVAIDCHPCPESEPIYTEIPVALPSLNVPVHFTANSNPSAVYAIVNKLTTSKLNLSPIHNSFQSLHLGNDLSVSIENFLDQMNGATGRGCSVGGGNDDRSVTVANEKHLFCFTDIEGNQRKCEQERMQLQCVNAITYADTASISTTSQLTDCICNDVGNGDAINDDIAAMIDRIESMDPFLRNSQRVKAVPEESDLSYSGQPDCCEREEPNYWEIPTNRVCSMFDVLGIFVIIFFPFTLYRMSDRNCRRRRRRHCLQYQSTIH